MNVARLRTYAGLAAAVVPCAIIVHLIAEAAALGRDGLDRAFVVRHAYFGLLFFAAAAWFASAAGVGRSSGDRRRRCALLRAELRGRHGRVGIATLVAANLGFFALTQAVEGVPVAAGALTLSLAIAITGSLAAALLVCFFGYAIIAATLDAVIGRTPRRSLAHRLASDAPAAVSPRRVAATYTLLRPNRPPPILSHI